LVSVHPFSRMSASNDPSWWNILRGAAVDEEEDSGLPKRQIYT